MRKSHVLALVGAVAFMATSVQAAFVIKPVEAKGTSTGVYTGNNYNPTHTIDGRGLVSDTYAVSITVTAAADYNTIATEFKVPGAHDTGSAVPAANGWMRHTISGNQLFDNQSNHWAQEGSTMFRTVASTVGAKRRIAFDLGDNYDLTSMHLWGGRQWANYNDSFKTAQIYSITAAEYAGALENITVSGQPTVTFASGTSNTADRGDDYALSLSNTRYVMIDVLTAGGTNAVSSEVRFVGTTVPEPASLALLGMGSLLALKRRRA